MFSYVTGLTTINKKLVKQLTSSFNAKPLVLLISFYVGLSFIISMTYGADVFFTEDNFGRSNYTNLLGQKEQAAEENYQSTDEDFLRKYKRTKIASNIKSASYLFFHTSINAAFTYGAYKFINNVLDIPAGDFGGIIVLYSVLPVANQLGKAVVKLLRNLPNSTQVYEHALVVGYRFLDLCKQEYASMLYTSMMSSTQVELSISKIKYLLSLPTTKHLLTPMNKLPRSFKNGFGKELDTFLYRCAENFYKKRYIDDSILCVGLPGIGKTHSAQRYAEALNIPLVFINQNEENLYGSKDKPGSLLSGYMKVARMEGRKIGPHILLIDDPRQLDDKELLHLLERKEVPLPYLDDIGFKLPSHVLVWINSNSYQKGKFIKPLQDRCSIFNCVLEEKGLTEKLIEEFQRKYPEYTEELPYLIQQVVDKITKGSSLRYIKRGIENQIYEHLISTKLEEDYRLLEN